MNPENLFQLLGQATGLEGPLWQWLFCGVLFLFFWLLGLLLRRRAPRFLQRLARRLGGDGEALLHALARPLSGALWLVGGCLALWGLPLPAAVMDPLHSLLAPLLGLGLVWQAARAGCCAVDNAPFFRFGFLGQAEAVRRMLRRVIKAVIAALAAFTGLEILGVPVGSLLAGLGIGGLTLSLAAKDTAANLFAGLVLLVEKPFAIGDWVNCAGVEGTVEDITFRSTKIRTLENLLTVVPNSVVSAGVIANGSARRMRMAQATLGVRYDTPRPLLETLIARLQALLCADSAIAPETVVVRFSGFSASSLDLLVRYCTYTVNYTEYLAVCERVNLATLSLMEELGASFAYPTTTVQLEGPPPAGPGAGGKQ